MYSKRLLLESMVLEYKEFRPEFVNGRDEARCRLLVIEPGVYVVDEPVKYKAVSYYSAIYRTGTTLLARTNGNIFPFKCPKIVTEMQNFPKSRRLFKEQIELDIKKVFNVSSSFLFTIFKYDNVMEFQLDVGIELTKENKYQLTEVLGTAIRTALDRIYYELDATVAIMHEGVEILLIRTLFKGETDTTLLEVLFDSPFKDFYGDAFVSI